MCGLLGALKVLSPSGPFAPTLDRVVGISTRVFISLAADSCPWNRFEVLVTGGGVYNFNFLLFRNTVSSIFE